MELSKAELRIFKKIFDDIDGRGNILNPSHIYKYIIKFIITKLNNNILSINLNDLNLSKGKKFKNSTIHLNHKKYLDNECYILPEYVKILKERFDIIKNDIGKDMESSVSLDDDDATTSLIESSKDCYIIENHHSLTHFNKALFKSAGDCKFKYIFNKTSSPPDININTIQQFNVIINNKIDTLSYPARLKYICNKCGNVTVCDNNKILSNPTLSCEHHRDDKKCNGSLRVPTPESDNIAMNVYDTMYSDDNNETKSIISQSMLDLVSGEYEVAGLVLSDDKVPYFLILDVKRVKKKDIEFNIPTIHSQNILNIVIS